MKKTFSKKIRVESRPLNFENSISHRALQLFFRVLLIFSQNTFKIFNFHYKTLNFAIIIKPDHAQKFLSKTQVFFFQITPN